MAETSDSDEQSETSDRADEAADEERLDDIDDGAGCVEIWSHLTENREED
ncbi:hypothetical protein [Natrinema sp. 74]